MKIKDLIAEAMEKIAEEAGRQGFQVRQIRSSAWQFRRGQDNWIVTARTPVDLLDILAILENAGLIWSHWSDPEE